MQDSTIYSTKCLNTIIFVLSGVAILLFGEGLYSPYNKLNGLFPGIIYVLYSINAIVIINKTPSSLSVGILIGESWMMLIYALQNGLFWITVHQLIKSMLHFLVVLLEIGFNYIIFQWKNDVIDVYARYETILEVRDEDDDEAITTANI